MDLEKCPLCGCNEIGEGSFVGYGGLINSNSLIPKTQEVVASVV